MGYYSDPTAARAMGNINREFSRLEKRAKALRKLLKEGKISPKTVERAQEEYKGIYKHILTNVLNAPDEEDEQDSA